MLIWGGYNLGPELTGGLYTPSTDSWLAVNTNGAPKTFKLGSTAWTGSEMITLSGGDSVGRYDPALNAWIPLGPFSNFSFTSAVWDNGKLWCIGEYVQSPPLSALEIAPPRWTFIDGPAGMSTGGADAFGAWLGDAFYVLRPATLERVTRYKPSQPLYLYQKP